MKPQPLYVICDKDGNPVKDVYNYDKSLAYFARWCANGHRNQGEVVVRYLPEVIK